MASVTPVRRARGYAWRVQARDEDRKMKQETFHGNDARKVEKAAHDFAKLVDRVGITEASRIRTARSGSAAHGGLTLDEWTEKYLDKASGILAGVTDGTRADYKRDAKTYISPRLGEMPVDAITPDDVAKWIAWMAEQPSTRYDDQTLSAKTIKNKHGLLSAMLEAAAGRGLRTGNPAKGAKISRTRKRSMTVLTQGEFAVLLHFIPEPHRPLVMWLAGTGMRWGEATALTWGDLDRDARPMRAYVTKAWKRGEARKGRVLGPPKSEAGERTVSVPDELVAALGKPGRGDRLVFPTTKGTPQWSGSFWPRIWTPAVVAANDDERCAEAGLTPIGKEPTIHDLRHSHASWLIAAGRPLPYIKVRLGHEKITTTVDTYGHLLPDAQQGDADAVAISMAGVLPQLALPADDDPLQIEA